MQFVWFYVPGPDNGFELKHSIRSVVQNFSGSAEIVVIGDRPKWYVGHFISCEKIKPARRASPEKSAFLDTQHKIVVSASHAEIDSEFVWMMDDQFILKPTTIEDLKTPREDPWYRGTSHREWHKLISATFSATKQKGKTAIQYGTHLPHHFEKVNLTELFQVYDYPKNLYLFEILYGNHFRLNPIPYVGFLKRLLKRPKSVNMLDEISEHVLNYQAPCYGNIIKEWLEAKFPVATAEEA